MARRREENGSGPNREAVETLIAELESDDLVTRVDAPLIAQARSMASAVDANPGSSQLAMQYRQVLKSLRDDVQREEERSHAEFMLSVRVVCREHMGAGQMPYCAQCVERYVTDVLGVETTPGQLQEAIYAVSDREQRA